MKEIAPGGLPTVSVTWVNVIVDTAGRKGVPQADLIRAAGCPAIPLDQPQARVPIDQVVRLWRAAVDLTGDHCFGLHAGEGVRPGSFNVVAYTVISSQTLRHALINLQRFQRLISEGARMQAIDRPPQVWLVSHPVQARLPFAPHQAEAVLAAIIVCLRWLLGHEFVPAEVRFRHSRLCPIAEYRRVLGCDPVFEAEFDGFAVPTELADRTLATGDADLCRLHEKVAADHIARLNAERSWRQRTGEALREGLLAGQSERPDIAAMLGVSTRVLQRRLAEEDTSFTDLLDTVRRELALELIADSTRGLGEIGAALGFSEPSAFYRAFRRWTGKAPGEYRQSS